MLQRWLVVLVLLFSPAALAQGGWPARPVRMIVPFAPGGASDFVARLLAPKLGEALGQQVIVENKPGASGNIGMEFAARSAPMRKVFFPKCAQRSRSCYPKLACATNYWE